MPVDSAGLGTWQVIQPAAATNLVTNPSFEIDTTGWVAVTCAMTRTAGAGVIGAYGLSCLASAASGNVSVTLSSQTIGTILTASAWVLADTTSVTLQLLGAAENASVSHPGDGAWHRLSCTVTMAATQTIVVLVADARAGAWTAFRVDGVQVEAGVSAASTYIDGDQEGCIWTGAPHASESTRDGRDPRGGAIVSLASLGWTEKTWGGVGAPDVETISQEIALVDGDRYQSQQAKPRVITLSLLAQVANLAALHAARRSLLVALNPNARSSRGPVRLRYTGAATPKTIDAVNESGFGFDKPYHQRAEMAELRFLAPDPIWQRDADETAVLTVGQTLNPVSGLAWRKTDGTWSSLGGGIAAATPARQLNGAIRLTDGRLVVGGENYVDFGGVAANDNLAVRNLLDTTWSILGGGAPNGSITAMAYGAEKLLYAAGNFTTIGGFSINRIARWNQNTDTWTSVGTGGASAAFNALAIDPATGYLWAVGNSTSPVTAGGVTINGAGIWDGSAWFAANTGLPAGWITFGPQALTVGPDGAMYVALSGATNPALVGVYRWTPGVGWVAYVLVNSGGSLNALHTARGQLFVGGSFTTIGGAPAGSIAAISTSGVNALNGGIFGSGSYQGWSIASTTDGLVYVAGLGGVSFGGVGVIDDIAIWNGSGWLPFPADLPNTATHTNDQYTVRSLRDGSIIVAWAAASGTFATSMVTEAVTVVTNTGTADAYPIIDFYGAAGVYSITNLTTGQGIVFSSVTLTAAEIARLDLRPGRKTFKTFARDLLPNIVPGSVVASFKLAPGANRISLMMLGGVATMVWRPREWSVD